VRAVARVYRQAYEASKGKVKGKGKKTKPSPKRRR
jgi:hypothetical protein